MRKPLLIILVLLAVLLVGNVAAVLVFPAYKAQLQGFRAKVSSSVSPVQKTSSGNIVVSSGFSVAVPNPLLADNLSGAIITQTGFVFGSGLTDLSAFTGISLSGFTLTADEESGMTNDQIVASLKSINETLRLLVIQQSNQLQKQTSATASTQATNNSGENLPSTKPVNDTVITLPKLLLLRLVPYVKLQHIPNAGIFGITSFDDKLTYSTYIDNTKHIKMYAFGKDYDNLLANFQLLNTLYNVNQTDTFFGYTFFINPVKADSTVRFVIKINDSAVAIEVPKAGYADLKKLLLHTS